MKKIITLFLILIINPVFAGDLVPLINNNDNQEESLNLGNQPENNTENKQKKSKMFQILNTLSDFQMEFLMKNVEQETNQKDTYHVSGRATSGFSVLFKCCK